MKHTDFILSPITGLIKETVSACMGIGDGMETSTIAEHILQSLFLQMTGFQELFYIDISVLNKKCWVNVPATQKRIK